MARTISDEARAKANVTRAKRSVFNRYLKSLSGRRANSAREQLTEIDETLEHGTRERLVAKFVDGKRKGTERKHVPLLPADRARLIAKRRQLVAKLEATGKPSLREEFLSILPDYAASQGWDRAILRAVGVPEKDLDEAGID